MEDSDSDNNKGTNAQSEMPSSKPIIFRERMCLPNLKGMYVHPVRGFLQMRSESHLKELQNPVPLMSFVEEEW